MDDNENMMMKEKRIDHSLVKRNGAVEVTVSKEDFEALSNEEKIAFLIRTYETHTNYQDFGSPCYIMKFPIGHKSLTTLKADISDHINKRFPELEEKNALILENKTDK